MHVCNRQSCLVATLYHKVSLLQDIRKNSLFRDIGQRYSCFQQLCPIYNGTRTEVFEHGPGRPPVQLYNVKEL